jgi:hypothetical protein
VLAPAVAPHEDVKPRAAAPPRLLDERQGHALDAHAIVTADHVLGRVGQERVEVEGIAQGGPRPCRGRRAGG